MRLSRFFVAVAAPLAVACGIGTSQVGPHGGGGGGGDGDAGSDAGCPAAQPEIFCEGCGGSPQNLVCIHGAWSCPPSPPCPSPPPVPVCSGTEPTCTGCHGETVSPQCVGSTWECPAFGCPIEVDAGCGTPPLDLCLGAPPCDGGAWEPVCASGAWTCVCPAVDAGPPDASPEIFACVEVGCDALTSYCQLTTGGAVVPDGGGFAAQCIPLPSSCGSGPATCACVQATQGIGCSCVEQHGDVTVTCELP